MTFHSDGADLVNGDGHLIELMSTANSGNLLVPAFLASLPIGGY
jgi:hypothetical protein